jgi:hypothetical protein
MTWGCRGIIEVPSQHLQRDQGMPRNPSVKIAGVPVEIRTKHLLNEYSTMHVTATSKCLVIAPNVKRLISKTATAKDPGPVPSTAVPTSLISIPLFLGFRGAEWSADFSTQILYAFLLSLIQTIRQIHRNLHDFTIVTSLGDEYA